MDVESSLGAFGVDPPYNCGMGARSAESREWCGASLPAIDDFDSVSERVVHV